MKAVRKGVLGTKSKSLLAFLILVYFKWRFFLQESGLSESEAKEAKNE